MRARFGIVTAASKASDLRSAPAKRAQLTSAARSRSSGINTNLNLSIFHQAAEPACFDLAYLPAYQLETRPRVLDKAESMIDRNREIDAKSVSCVRYVIR